MGSKRGEEHAKEILGIYEAVCADPKKLGLLKDRTIMRDNAHSILLTVTKFSVPSGNSNLATQATYLQDRLRDLVG